eukprot:201073_1
MFHSKHLLFENLCKHSNWTVNEVPPATGPNMGDSFNVSVDNDKDDTQSIAQVPIPEEPPSGLVVNYLNIVNFEHIDSVRTQREQSSIQPEQPSNQPELAVDPSEHSFIGIGRSISQSDPCIRPMI